MTALRNTVMGLMHWAGHTNIAVAYRRFTAPLALALDLTRIVLGN